MLSVETLAPVVVTSPLTAAASRPTTFCEHYIATRSVPYSFVQGPEHPSSSGGVLRAGQALWLVEAIQRARLPQSVHAFVENLGFVSLDPHLIKKGDGSLSQS